MEPEQGIKHEAITGVEYHNDAIENNERGNTLGALISADRAMLSYKLEGNPEFVTMFAVRSLILRRVSREQNNDEYLIAAKHDSEAGLEIGRRGGYPGQMSTLLLHHGKVLVDLQRYEEAVKAFQEALDHFPNSAHNKKAMEADIRANLETAKLMLGDDSAEERALQAIADIKSSGDATNREINVWTASSYLRLAKGVYAKNRDKAMSYLSQAGQIIDPDPIELKLLKSDLEKLKSELQ